MKNLNIKKKLNYKILSILFLLFVISIFSGCGIKSLTANIIQDINPKISDDDYFNTAISGMNSSVCLNIEFSLKQEECIIKIAKQTKNIDTCNLIKNTIMKENCIQWIKKSI
jgi:hypothetical protein